MKNFKIIVFTLLSLTLITKTYSQGNVSIHFGPSFPVSDFASDDIDDEDAGGAAVGLNVGLQYIYPLSESGLGLFCGIDMNYNGLKKDVKDDVEELYEAMGINNPDIKYYKYINIPLTAGLNYTYQADDKIGVFANAGLAVNFMKITDMELKANGQTVTTEMDLANSIGFKIGGGILINQKTSISIDYLALGEHDIEGEVKTTGYSEDIDGEGKVDLLTLTLGFKF
jgi:opacity protein-like surface antigen